MSTESISDRREHIRSVGVTALAALLGVAAALASMAVTGDLPAREAAGETLPQAFVVVAILVQLALLNVTSIYDEDEFGMKHNLYVAFMTFSFWFITWGILLTSEAA
ncbi:MULTISPECIES: EMC6-like membrane protein [Halopiger]|uniref:Uncharacterized protein n=2 Tax=Halopiger TaxID=387342 RepID=F8D9G6_HALXS|nr:MULTISPECIES: hypothetical protein [Halopiger]AEH38052.1 hypothetical protein Halxa_3441 [Halopiger xanaduensis SH-6]RKD95942.1 hypothetical protein ATJ93_2805 [Halopiger aswanensis]